MNVNFMLISTHFRYSREVFLLILRENVAHISYQYATTHWLRVLHNRAFQSTTIWHPSTFFFHALKHITHT